MKKLNLKSQEKEKSNFFGMPLPPHKELFLKRRLDDLANHCPSTSRIKLNLEKVGDSIKGTLTINNFSTRFSSIKIAKEPIQTYFFLQDDIKSQLLEWKRNRFSNSLLNQLNINSNSTHNCA